jgi:hypothetical protein
MRMIKTRMRIMKQMGTMKNRVLLLIRQLKMEMKRTKVRGRKDKELQKMKKTMMRMRKAYKVVRRERRGIRRRVPKRGGRVVEEKVMMRVMILTWMRVMVKSKCLRYKLRS